jgi:hypothetical protein
MWNEWKRVWHGRAAPGERPPEESAPRTEECVRPADPVLDVRAGQAQGGWPSASGEDAPDRRPANPQPSRDLRVAQPLGLEPTHLIGPHGRRARAPMRAAFSSGLGNPRPDPLPEHLSLELRADRRARPLNLLDRNPTRSDMSKSRRPLLGRSVQYRETASG